jgi:uncharacterized protein (TIGR02145 family)
MSIETDPVGTMSVSSTTIKTTTTAPNGYKLYLGMTGNTNDLINTSNATLRIPSTSGTLTSPTALSAEGTWGYALSSTASKVITPNGFDTTYTTGSSFTPNGNKFASIPVSTENPQLIASSNGPSAAAGDSLNVYYGVSANYNVPNGTYSNTVTYTAIADSGAGHNLFLSPTSTSNVNGGEPLTVATTLYAITTDGISSDIPASIYMLTAAELANVHNGTPVSLYNAKQLTCSRITTAQTLSFDCTTIAASLGSYYIYVDVPTYSTSYEAPFIVANPTSFFTLTTMQQMADYPELCMNATTPRTTAQYEDTDGTHIGDPNYVPTLTLTDTRDGERYKIRKLADGNCWMTENLRHELREGEVLTPATTDVAINTTVGAATQLYNQSAGSNYYDWGVGSGGSETEANTDRWLSRSTKVGNTWSTETNPVQSGLPDNRKQNLTGEDQKAGVFYNWYTATAGTGTWNITTGGIETQSSICPAGWELPRYSNVNGSSTLAPNGSWMHLIRDVYGIIGTSQGDQGDGGASSLKAHAFPLSLPFSGRVYWQSGGIEGQGAFGYWWTVGSHSQTSARYLYVDSVGVLPEDSHYRLNGFNVRCVAKTFWSISEMQQMTQKIAASATTPSTSAPAADTTGEHQGDNTYVPQRTLTDVRDGETYRVRKLADGNVWMTENLRVNSGNSLLLDASTSDITSGTWLLPASSSSWTFPAQADNLTEEEMKVSQVFKIDSEEVIYNFAAATVGGSTVTGIAPDSICPKSWKLPVREDTNYLKSSSVYAIASNSTWDEDNVSSYNKILSFPLDFTVPGRNNGQSTPNYDADWGGIWTPEATRSSVAAASYWGYRDNKHFVWISNSDLKVRGLSVRCIAYD